MPLGLPGRLRSGSVLLVLLAVAVGAATHVLRDEFTHPGRWGAEHLAVLSRSWAGSPGTRWAQEVSGVLGGLVLPVWLARWWRRTPDSGAQPRPRWWAPWAVLVVAGLAGGPTAGAGAPDLRSAAVAAAFRGGGVLLAGVLVLSALRWARRPT